MILPVYIEPQPILRNQTAQIPEITDDIRRLAFDMRETMHNASGIGLAAPQIGQPVAMAVIEHDDRESDFIPFTVLINPQIVWRSNQKRVMEEGCLSIPGVYGDVKRPSKVTVQFTDLEGRQRELTADHLFARVIQHELDHLKGVLFTDYVPEEARIMREILEYPKL
jgi:peptide deformylase